MVDGPTEIGLPLPSTNIQQSSTMRRRTGMSVAESPERRLEPIPTEVGDEREELLLSSAADLSPDVQYGERRVEVTNQRVRVLSGSNGSTAELQNVPLKQIKEARTEPLVGGGRLEVTVDGRVIPLVEYTAARSAEFSEMA